MLQMIYELAEFYISCYILLLSLSAHSCFFIYHNTTASKRCSWLIFYSVLNSMRYLNRYAYIYVEKVFKIYSMLNCIVFWKSWPGSFCKISLVMIIQKPKIYSLLMKEASEIICSLPGMDSQFLISPKPYSSFGINNLRVVGNLYYCHINLFLRSENILNNYWNLT